MLCCSARTLRSRYGRLPFLFRRKTGRYAREAQALRRTDAGISCVVVGRNTTAGMPPSSALSLPVSAAPARLRFPCKPTTQKKVNCGAAFFLLFCCFRQHDAQNGRFVCEPSVFMLQAECAGTHLFSDKSTIPQCLLFLFFKKRKRPPSFLFRRKEAKENRLRLSFFSTLLSLSPTCNTKRTVRM